MLLQKTYVTLPNFRKVLSSLITLLLVFYLSNIVAFAQFSDTTNHQYAEAVEFVQGKGIISGSNGLFYPNDKITRGQLTKIVVVKKYGIAINCQELPFLDIQTSAFKSYICQAAKDKIVSGFSDGNFYPNRNISAEGAMKVIANSYGLVSNPNPNLGFQPYVNALSDKNAIPTTITSLNYEITRAEVAEIIYRLENPNIAAARETKNYASLVAGNSTSSPVSKLTGLPTSCDKNQTIKWDIDKTSWTCADITTTTSTTNWSESKGDVYFTTGEVGIGTSAPSSLLHLKKDNGNTAFRLESNINQNTTIDFWENATNQANIYYNGTTDNMVFTTTTGNILLTPSKNIGIGKDNPVYKLDVNGTINATGLKVNGVDVPLNVETFWKEKTGTIAYQNNVGIATTNAASEKLEVVGNIQLLGNNNSYKLKNNTTEWAIKLTDPNFSVIEGITTRMTFLTGGNVGIGTSSPSSTLHIIDTEDAIVTINSGNGYNSGIMLSSNGQEKFSIVYGTGSTLSDPAGLHIRSHNSSVNNEFTIDPQGNVGVGSLVTPNELNIGRNGIISIKNSSNQSSIDSDLGAINIGDSNGTRQAQILVERGNNTSSSSDLPTNISFWSTPDDSNVPVQRMKMRYDGITELFGQIKINGGTPGAGYVLTSDATGLATWQDIDQIGSGDSAWVVTGGSISHSGSNVGIGTQTPATPLEVNGVIAAFGGNSTQWNQAYAWGNHASESYLKTETDPTLTDNDNVTIGSGSGTTMLNFDSTNDGTITWDGVNNQFEIGPGLNIKQSTDAYGNGLKITSSDLFAGGMFRESTQTGGLIIQNNGIDTMTFKNGNVGIGVSTPEATLHLFENTGNSNLRLQATSGSNTAVEFFGGVDQSQQASLYVNGVANDGIHLISKGNIELNANTGTGDVDVNANLDVQGTITASGTITPNADYAEWFEKEENTNPADLIGLNLKTGKVRKYRPGDKFIGIQSTKPGVSGNQYLEYDEMQKTHTLVGLLGQLDFNPNQVLIENRTLRTLDGVEIGVLLSNGKVLIGI